MYNIVSNIIFKDFYKKHTTLNFKSKYSPPSLFAVSVQFNCFQQAKQGARHYGGYKMHLTTLSPLSGIGGA